MTTFDDRENAFENKYAHDQELEFKAVARRNKLLGLWAAEKLGLPEGDHAAYAKDVVIADLDAPGDDDLIQKVLKDFHDAGIAVDEKEIRQQLLRLLPLAKEQLRTE